jgi:isoquinoline 1-oxidoreductase subunit alpha
MGRRRDSLPGAVEGEGGVANYPLTVNGRQTEVDADPGTPLLWVLREHLKMTGTKYGCGIGACGACTVHVAGVAMRSCLLPISLVGNRSIATIETMANDPVGRAVQDAWVAADVVQCGYCQSGQIMTAVALLKTVPKPTAAQIEQGMGGNICRCGTYVRIRQAIARAAQQLG